MRLDAKFVESVRVYIDIYIHTYFTSGACIYETV